MSRNTSMLLHMPWERMEYAKSFNYRKKKEFYKNAKHLRIFQVGRRCRNPCLETRVCYDTCGEQERSMLRVMEHFCENDERMKAIKNLCKTTSSMIYDRIQV